MDNCKLCKMKEELDDCLYIGNGLFFKQCKKRPDRAFAISIIHKSEFTEKDRFEIQRIFKLLDCKGDIVWRKPCDHAHCYITL